MAGKLRVVGKHDPEQLKLRESFEKQYARYLHLLTEEIFVVACDVKDWTWADLAKAAGLSYSTVAKLGYRETRYPRHMTIWKMAKAVGLNYELLSPSDYKYKVQRKAG